MVDVYLSPSVQQNNIGYGNYGTEEQRMNQIADIVQYELDRHGVSYARNRPDQTLTQIVRESNALNPKLHVAIHSNASPGSNVRGAEVFAHRFGGKSEQLARSIFRQLSPLTPTADLGVKESAPLFNGQGFYELRRTTSPAVLIETAFHDNPQDADFIIDNIYEIGNAISKGILNELKIPYRQDTADNINYLKARYNGSSVK